MGKPKFSNRGGKRYGQKNKKGEKRNSKSNFECNTDKKRLSKSSKVGSTKNARNTNKFDKSKLSLTRNVKSLGKPKFKSSQEGEKGKRYDDESRSKYHKKTGRHSSTDDDIEVVSADAIDFMNPMLIEGNDVGDDGDEKMETRKMVAMQNRKKKSAGGFQSMGLSYPVYTGVLRRGYKVPTPIQRKTIPLILDGQDVVAMARTGSGKTAAFLIPMFEKLVTHNATLGARALILSPTRELALQTLKFAKEIGKYTQLRAAVILGGDRMDDQFEAMHNNPDIIIATPGRLMHVIVEMEVKLRQIEYIVFDEADRLFEMGFSEQLHEILHRLPEMRQTLLFSATLPRMLVEFARAGLHDPTLIRLDVDSKLSDQLQTSFLLCRREDKPATLMYLLQNVVTSKQQTVIFSATMHHVEFINQILERIHVPYACIYSSMDPTARKISIAKFTNKKCMVLVVTDIAARGIDIPMLDVVVNYNFPGKPKLFVHRVGRVARAGRTGSAYSIVSPEEMPYLLDLHLFLGRPLNLVPKDDSIKGHSSDAYCGRVPQTIIDEGNEWMQQWMSVSQDFKKAEDTANNAYKQYVKSRPLPSSESVRRVKDLDKNDVKIGVHPAFGKHSSTIEYERRNLLTRMKSYKPVTTIFEINSTQQKQAMPVMKQKREKHERIIRLTRAKKLDKIARDSADSSQVMMEGDSSSQQQLEETFKVIVGQKKKLQIKDEENYLNYRPKDFRSEMGLSLKSSFEKDVTSETMDITADSLSDMKQQNRIAKWDRKKKKFVQSGGNVGKDRKVKTEGGTWIKASYKSNIYKDWLKRTKLADQIENDGSDDESTKIARPIRNIRGIRVLGTAQLGWQNKMKKDSLSEAGLQAGRTRGGKLKNPDQILKERRRKKQVNNFQSLRRKKNEVRRIRQK